MVSTVEPMPEKKTRHGLRLLINVAGAFAARGINLVTAFLTVPLAVAGLGAHDYGIFAVILSAATFVTYADFGMGLAMVNPITAAEARGDHAETRRLIAATWSLLLVIATAVLVLGVAAVGGLAYAGSIGTDNMVAWLVFVAGVAVGLPAAITQRVLFALQRNYEANLWMSAAKVASLGGVYVAYHLHAGLASYVFAMLCIPALFGWINTAWLFRFSRPDLAPSVQVSAAAARRLMPEGLRYTVLQMGPYLEIGFDIVLIGAVLGPAVTTSYDLITRAFNYVPALAMVGVMPLWPAIAGALAGGDKAWAEKIKRLSAIVLLVVTAIPALILAIYHREALWLWTGHEVTFPLFVALPLAFVAVSISYIGLQNSVILANEGPVRICRLQILFAAVLIPAKFAAVYFFGIPGLAITTAVLYIPKHIAMFYISKSSTNSVRR